MLERTRRSAVPVHDSVDGWLDAALAQPPVTATTPVRRMRIALVGTRGVPAAYGGFETAVQEVGCRLAARGHEVTVYCRRSAAGAPRSFLGMRLVHLPAIRRKSLETLSHTGLSALHLLLHRRQDVVIVFNAANAPFLPLIAARGVPAATHVDGLEWRRAKWGPIGRRYYRFAECLSVRWSQALIADAPGIAEYYREEFGAGSHLIAYGAPILRDTSRDRLEGLGLRAGKYHVVVARFEQENQVHLAIEGYLSSGARHPLVVVGAAPYADRYTGQIRELAASDERVRLLGAVWDQDLLDQLYAHALTYVHGHSVGGTNPSLLRAMGAGTAVIAYDVNFNRGVLGEHGRFFDTSARLGAQLEAAETDPGAVAERAWALQQRASARYRWDEVTDRYEELCRALVDGERSVVPARGRRLVRRAAAAVRG